MKFVFSISTDTPGVHSDFVRGQMREGSVTLATEKLGCPLPNEESSMGTRKLWFSPLCPLRCALLPLRAVASLTPRAQRLWWSASRLVAAKAPGEGVLAPPRCACCCCLLPAAPSPSPRHQSNVCSAWYRAGGRAWHVKWLLRPCRQRVRGRLVLRGLIELEAQRRSRQPAATVRQRQAATACSGKKGPPAPCDRVCLARSGGAPAWRRENRAW